MSSEPTMTNDTIKEPSNGNLGPWWARLIAYVGAPTFLLAFLLGAIPGLSSPLIEVREQAKRLERHERTTRRLLQMTALVCQGVWQGNPEQQRQCRDAMSAIITDDRTDRLNEGP